MFYTMSLTSQEKITIKIIKFYVYKVKIILNLYKLNIRFFNLRPYITVFFQVYTHKNTHRSKKNRGKQVNFEF